MNPGQGVTPDARQFQAWFTAALREAGVSGSAEGDSLVAVGADGVGTPVVDVPAAGWVAAARCARDQLGMDFLDWLSAVDEPEGNPAGLDVVLHLAATDSFGTPDRTVRRLLLRTRVPETALTLPSLTSLWPGVAWHERETHEMFGLAFTGFSDGTEAGLRPLLLPDGFEGTPLRKSFVLAARAAKAWPGAKDPGDSGGKAPARRKTLPPGVPDPSWGPHEPGAPREAAAPVRPARRAPRAGVGAARRAEALRTPDATDASGSPREGGRAAAAAQPPPESEPKSTASDVTQASPSRDVPPSPPEGDQASDPRATRPLTNPTNPSAASEATATRGAAKPADTEPAAPKASSTDKTRPPRPSNETTQATDATNPAISLPKAAEGADAAGPNASPPKATETATSLPQAAEGTDAPSTTTSPPTATEPAPATMPPKATKAETATSPPKSLEGTDTPSPTTSPLTQTEAAPTTSTTESEPATSSPKATRTNATHPPRATEPNPANSTPDPTKPNPATSSPEPTEPTSSPDRSGDTP